MKSFLQSSYSIPYAPYGGFLAHRDVFQNLGLPKKDFILYGDDTEYTYRLTSGGGKIFLCLGAHIEDVEASWYADPGVTPPLELD